MIESQHPEIAQMQRSTRSDAGALPSCTVIVCTKDRPEQLERCLKSLRQMQYPGLGIHVIENGSRSSEQLATHFDACYSHLKEPGLSRARNVGARAATTQLVAFIDDDAVADPCWLACAASEFTQSSVGIVTGPVLSMSAETHFRSLGDKRFMLDSTSPDWFARANFGGLGHGGNMLLRREVFNDWRGFDERLGRGAMLSGGEESFAFFELLSRGWGAVYVPAARVHHAEPGAEESIAKARSTARNAIAYFLFLFANARGFRGELVRYLTTGFLGRKREWRGPAVPPVRLSWGELFSARFAGIFTFWRTWRHRSG